MTSPTKPRFRYLKLFITTAVSLCLVTPLFVPMLLSTKAGQRKILEFINQRIDGTLTARSISFSLFGPQRFEQVELKDSEGTKILSVDSIAKNSSLLAIYYKGAFEGYSELTGLDATIIAYPDGTTNIERTLTNNPLPVDLAPLSAPIALSKTYLTFDFSQDIMLKANGKTKHGEIEGEFFADIRLDNVSFQDLSALARSPGTLAKNGQNNIIKISAENFPVALIDSMAGLQNPKLKDSVTLLLGSTLNLNIEEGNVSNENQLSLNFSIRSPNLGVNLESLLTSEKLTIVNPGTVIYALNPDFADIFLTHAGIKTLKLSQPTQFFGFIENFSLPFAKDSLFNFDELAIRSRLDLSQAEFYDDAIIGDMALKKFSASVETEQNSPYLSFKLQGEASQAGQPILISIAGETRKNTTVKGFRIPPLDIDISRIPIPLIDYIFDLDNILVDLLGTEADIQIQTKKDKNETQIALSFKSSYLQIPSMKVTLSDKLYITEPPLLRYTLGKNLSKRLSTQNSLFNLPIDGPFEAVLSLDPIENFEQINSFETLNLSGLLAFDAIPFSFPVHDSIAFSLNDVQIPWRLDGVRNELSASLSGKSEWVQEATQGAINGKFFARGWVRQGEIQFTGSTINTELLLNQVPTAFLNLFLKNDEIAVLLGTKLDLKLSSEILLEDLPSASADVELTGPQISMKGRFNLKNALTLKDNQVLNCEFILTPERFNALRNLLKASQPPSTRQDSITLIENTKVNLKINSLFYPLNLSAVSALAESKFDADLQADRLAILDTRDGQSLTFENLSAHLNAEDLKTQCSFNIQANQRSRQKNSKFLLKGYVEKALNPAGSINVEGLALQFDLKIADLPLDVFCRVICLERALNQKVEALFGQTLDAEMRVDLRQMNGPIQAKLRGENGNINLDAQLERGNLFLNSPFFAECSVTPELGRSILQDVFPLLSGISAADQPLQISIDHRGFYFPVRDFDFRRLSIQNASISLGKVKFTNQGQLGEILSLLTPPDSELITVWFTPLYLSLTEGNLTLRRIDMLISDRFPIATWGNVNFIKDRVDLVIGLSGYALSHAFSLGPLDPNDFLQIPLRGTTSNAAIDKRKATARISALVAQSQGSPQGLVIGTVLNIMSGGLTEERPPAPTTNPLPWAKSLPARAESQAVEQQSPQPPKERKKTKIKPFDPVKQLEEEAGLLIQNLFE